MYQKLLKDIPGRFIRRRSLGPIIMRLTRKKADGRSARSSGIKYDDRSPPETEKVLGTGEKPAWHFTPDVMQDLRRNLRRLNK